MNLAARGKNPFLTRRLRQLNSPECGKGSCMVMKTRFRYLRYKKRDQTKRPGLCRIKMYEVWFYRVDKSCKGPAVADRLRERRFWDWAVQRSEQKLYLQNMAEIKAGFSYPSTCSGVAKSGKSGQRTNIQNIGIF